MAIRTLQPHEVQTREIEDWTMSLTLATGVIALWGYSGSLVIIPSNRLLREAPGITSVGFPCVNPTCLQTLVNQLPCPASAPAATWASSWQTVPATLRGVSSTGLMNISQNPPELDVL